MPADPDLHTARALKRHRHGLDPCIRALLDMPQRDGLQRVRRRSPPPFVTPTSRRQTPTSELRCTPRSQSPSQQQPAGPPPPTRRNSPVIVMLPPSAPPLSALHGLVLESFLVGASVGFIAGAALGSAVVYALLR